MRRRRSAGSGVNLAFAEGKFADTGVDGAGRLVGGLEELEMPVEGSVVHDLLVQWTRCLRGASR